MLRAKERHGKEIRRTLYEQQSINKEIIKRNQKFWT